MSHISNLPYTLRARADDLRDGTIGQVQTAKLLDRAADEIRSIESSSDELLDALEGFLKDHATTAKSYLTGNPERCNCVTCNRARAAIAKAKGESVPA